MSETPYAGQLNCFTRLRDLLVVYDRGDNNIIINHTYAGQLIFFTQLRVLLILHDHGNWSTADPLQQRGH
jgi:hypothetical protein